MRAKGFSDDIVEIFLDREATCWQVSALLPCTFFPVGKTIRATLKLTYAAAYLSDYFVLRNTNKPSFVLNREFSAARASRCSKGKVVT
jgi:hypothetical protein